MSIFSPDNPPVGFAVKGSDYQSALTVGGAGQSHEIFPQEAATPDAASRLLTHIETLGLAPVLTSDWPLGTFAAGSPFAQSGKVPYFNFPRTPTPDNPSPFFHVNVAALLVEYERYGKFTDILLVQWYGGPQ